MNNKNNRGLIAIIIVLFLIIIGLLSYIIFEKKDNKEYLKEENTTINQSTTLNSFDFSNNIFKLKLEKNKMYKINEDFNLDISKLENLEEITYEFYVDKDKVTIIIGKDFNTIYINGKVIVEANFIKARILSNIKLYNNTLIIMFSYAWDENPQTIALDIKNEKVISEVCFPETNGKCTGFEYEFIEQEIIESEYSVDYNNELSKTIINKEKLDCSDKFMEKFHNGCNGDEECERKGNICFAP